LKIDKIECCITCRFNKFFHEPRINRFKCLNDDSKRKNGNYRIINRKIALSDKFPGWCTLEDYEDRPDKRGINYEQNTS